MTEKEREPQGLSLLDIVPLTEKVKISENQYLAVTGISTRGIVSLFVRFPEMQKWFAGAGKGIAVSSLAAEAPDALAAIIAAGCGTPGNAAAEDMAGTLPVEMQLDILEAIGRLTFKNGFGPFVQRIVALAALAQSVNYGRVLATKSPQQSKPSLPAATTQTPSGT